MATSNLCKSKCVTKIGTSYVPGEFDVIRFQAGEARYYDVLNSFVATPANANTPISNVIATYGQESFYKAVDDVNKFFKGKTASNYNYPLLDQRLSAKTDFLPIEIASFIQDLEYDPTDLSRQTQIDDNTLYEQFEQFYTKDFSQNGMGSFCAILPNIFGAIGGFFTAFEGVKGLLADAQKLAENLKNFNLSFSLKSLLDTLKENIKNVVDKVVEKAKAQLKNIKLAFEDFDSFVKTNIAAKFEEVKAQAETFFNDLSIEKLKGKVEGLIDYASNIFKDPTLEDIQFLLYRFCSFVSNIENAIKGVLSPLQNMKLSLTEAGLSIQVRTAGVSRNAVLAGAIRLTPDQRRALRDRAKSVQPSRRGTNGGAVDSPAGRQTYDGAPLGEYGQLSQSDIQNAVPWNDGKGLPGKVTFTSRWPGILGNEEGWAPVDIRVKALIRLVADVFGKEIKILSANRPKWYNDQLSKRSTGVAKNSLHIQGLALDCTWSGFNDSTMEDFIVIARYFGFKGIGRYRSDGFVHVDLGAKRSWGSSPNGTGENGAAAVAAFKGQRSQAQEAVQEQTGPTEDLEPAVNEDRGYTSEDVASVEKLRQFNEDLGGGSVPAGEDRGINLTPGERAYAISRGYIS